MNDQVRDPKLLAERVGITVRGVYSALRRPHVQAEIERRVRQHLKGVALPAAAATAVALLSAESEYVKADIAKHLLGIHGVKPDANPSAASGGGGIRITINLPQQDSQVIDITPDTSTD